MTESKTPEQPQPAQLGFVRHENFESWYANNVQFYPTEFDLRMIFGEYDVANLSVQQHTAMTVSWVQAKIILYFLTLQLGIYEMSHEQIKIPPGIFPPEPEPPSGDLANDPAAREVYEYIKRIREQLVASQSR